MLPHTVRPSSSTVVRAVGMNYADPFFVSNARETRNDAEFTNTRKTLAHFSQAAHTPLHPPSHTTLIGAFNASHRGRKCYSKFHRMRLHLCLSEANQAMPMLPGTPVLPGGGPSMSAVPSRISGARSELIAFADNADNGSSSSYTGGISRAWLLPYRCVPWAPSPLLCA